MENRLAKVLSYILHPLLIPTYAILLMYRLPLLVSLPVAAKIWLIIIVFAFTFLLPALLVYLLYHLKVISSVELDNPRERSIPLIFTSLSFLGLNYILRDSGLPDYFLYILYGALFTLLAGLIVNLVYKISLHMMGWGATVAALISISAMLSVDIPLVIAGAIMISGIAGYARLKINAHNPTQVYLGFLAGIVIILLVTFVI
jgi:hypothetical protein